MVCWALRPPATGQQQAQIYVVVASIHNCFHVGIFWLVTVALSLSIFLCLSVFPCLSMSLGNGQSRWMEEAMT